jgi:phage regulator Rha-like protein
MKGKKQTTAEMVPVTVEVIERWIYLIRGQKVMLDRDLAELYGVPTRRLNEQVKRNRARFPEDFMFELTFEEANLLQASRSQNAILKRGQNIKYAPYAFTEHGVAMLSSVLNSDRAVEMNILIVRAFIRLREVLASHKDLARQIADLEREQKLQGSQIAGIYEMVKKLMTPPVSPKRRIGFTSE